MKRPKHIKIFKNSLDFLFDVNRATYEDTVKTIFMLLHTSSIDQVIAFKNNSFN